MEITEFYSMVCVNECELERGKKVPTMRKKKKNTYTETHIQ